MLLRGFERGEAMKHMIRSIGVLAAMVVVQPALAADLGRPAMKAPVAAPPVLNWYGSFIGVTAGYAWGSDPVEFTSGTGLYAGTIGTTIPRSIADSPAGFVAGVQYGSNYQLGPWVYGFLSDFSYSDIKDSETITLGGVGARTTFAEQRLKWFGTTRVRAGYLVSDNLLLYASGGLADGSLEVTASNNLVGTPCFVPGACPRFRNVVTHFGWAAGAGLEYRWGAWSATLDYIHYDLGTANFAYGDGISPSFITSSTKFSGDMVRGGINYKFNWTFFDLLTGGARL
jgi:outer membrane immunogenic protein